MGHLDVADTSRLVRRGPTGSAAAGFGQGALLMRNPAALANPFYLLAPGLDALSVDSAGDLATIIASLPCCPAPFH